MRYKVFGRHTGLRVSELVLGAGTFGTRWGHGAEPDEARRILDAYAEAGGNFVDTADSYQFGQSEELLGQFLEGRREVLRACHEIHTGRHRRTAASSSRGTAERPWWLRWRRASEGSRRTVSISTGSTMRTASRRPRRSCAASTISSVPARSLCGPLRFPGVARRPCCHHRRAARLGADRGPPGRAQPGPAHDRAGAAADGPGAGPRHRRLVAARRRHADRQVSPRREGSCRGLRRPRVPAREQPAADRRSSIRCSLWPRRSARRRGRSRLPGWRRKARCPSSARAPRSSSTTIWASVEAEALGRADGDGSTRSAPSHRSFPTA